MYASAIIYHERGVHGSESLCRRRNDLSSAAYAVYCTMGEPSRKCLFSIVSCRMVERVVESMDDFVSRFWKINVVGGVR